MISASWQVTYGRLWAVPFIAVIALVCSALAACGSSPAGTSAGNGSDLCRNPGQVDGLVVERINTIPQNHPRFTFPAKITISDPAEARSVAHAVCKLPLMPSGNMSCFADWGVMYRLIFIAAGQKFPAVDVNASGCGDVKGLGQTRWTARSPDFWQTLGKAMGIAHPDQLTFSGQ